MLSRLWRGARATLPIALSCVPFGIAYGAVAGRSMAFWQAWLMSLALFAGTAQFIAASMLSQGAAYVPVLITGVLINLRLVLMSASIAPHVRKAPRALQPLMAQFLTDESFAVSMAAFERGPSDPLFFLGSGLTMYIIWQAASLTGIFFGANIPAGLGLDYALPGSLICLLFLLIRNRRAALIAILAAALGLGLYYVVSGTWSTICATLLAATLGVIWKRCRSQS